MTWFSDGFKKKLQTVELLSSLTFGYGLFSVYTFHDCSLMNSLELPPPEGSHSGEKLY
jgi:hypothetical protein